jgi:hypothetical protein
VGFGARKRYFRVVYAAVCVGVVVPGSVCS